MLCGEAVHARVHGVHDVAAKGDVVFTKDEAHVQGLKRRPSGVRFPGVIAENREVRGIAARGHAVRHGFCQAQYSLRTQQIHVRGPRGLQRGPSPQRFNRIIGHTVAEQDDVFSFLAHSFSPIRESVYPRRLFFSIIFCHNRFFSAVKNVKKGGG